MSSASPAADLRGKLAAEPGAMIETVAKEYGTTLREAAEALPDTMRRFAPGSAFVEVMGQVGPAGGADVRIAVTAADHAGRALLEPGMELGAVGEGHLGVLLGRRRPHRAAGGAGTRYGARASKSWLGRHAPGLLATGAGALVCCDLELTRTQQI